MKYRNYRLALMGCTAIAALSFGAVAEAQEAAKAAEGSVLETIVVKTTAKTARQKLQKGAADTPLASETSAETLREQEIDSVKDLGNTTEPGVDYVEGRAGTPGGMFIRGLGGARVATLIDDIPIPFLETLTRTGSASPTTGISDSANTFDFSSLSGVDVVRGADSSRIGSGAMSGALVMRTLEPEDLIGDGKNWGVLVKSGYESEDRSVSGSVAAAKKVGGTSILFQGGYKRGNERYNQGSIDTLGNGRTEPNPADTYQRNLMFKVRQEIEGGHRIGITAERFELNADTDLKTFQGTTVIPPFVIPYQPGGYFGYDDTKRERVSIDYEYEAPEAGGFIDAAKLTPYWQRLTKEAGSFGYRATGAAYERHNSTEESAFGVTGGTISTFETGSLDHTLRIGGNLSFFETDQLLVSVPNTAVTQADVPNVDGTRVGVYVDDEIAIGDTGFTLTPGLRFDWYDYNPKLTPEYIANTGYNYFGLGAAQSGSRFSPKLLVSYQATQDLNLFAQWSMSYRAPTVAELYSNFTNVAGGYGVVGNPLLKAETGQGFEVGANYDAGDLTGKLTLFHNRYKNFIDETSEYTSQFPAGYFPQFLKYSWENRNSVHISGVEAKARKEFANGFNLHASLAYTYGKDQDSGEFIRTIAPFKSIVGVGYEQESWGVDLSGIFAAGMRDDNVATTYDAPGYGVANLTGWWEPEQVKGLRVQAGVYNIFDKTYWNAVGVRDVNPTAGSTSNSNQPVAYYSEPGRTFKISLTKKF